MRTFFLILGLILIVCGSAIVFASPFIARRSLQRAAAAEETFPRQSPIFLRENLKVKLCGLGLLMPGFITILVLYAGKK